jgi:ribose 5-phosphate isomerase A
MYSQDDLKKMAAEAAIACIEEDMVIGVGSGSTVHYFIDELAKIKHKIDACVASSNETAKRLKEKGIPVLDMNVVPQISIYVDGADEINARGEMKKGGGGALTREKILATYAKKFIAIVDESKMVQYWGDFPVAVEVLPMARSAVARELMKLKCSPNYREGFITDNGNIILDVYQLELLEPKVMESQINQIVGVVENGIFAHRVADEVFMATQEGIVHWKN